MQYVGSRSPLTVLAVFACGVAFACSSGAPKPDQTRPAASRDAGAPHDAAARDAAAAAQDAAREIGSPPAAGSAQAVDDTLAGNAACQAISPFYVELGDAGGMLHGGSIGTGYTRDTEMEIASASKWIYGAYYVQKHGDISDADEIKFLNFTSGFASMDAACLGRSVKGCNQYTKNTAPGTTDHPGNDDSLVDRFDYNSGHLEAHAERYGGLGADTAATLPGDILAELGTDLQLSYDNPILAGGVRTSAGQYASFLQKILRGTLEMRDLLGSHTACTLSAEYSTLFHESCNAAYSPWWPATSGKLGDTSDETLVQNVHYSIAHWVEADGAFSSPGLFGFYPFIDSTKTWYGIIARRQVFKVFDEAHPDTSAYAQSVRCGQAVRAAWLTGKAQM